MRGKWWWAVGLALLLAVLGGLAAVLHSNKPQAVKAPEPIRIAPAQPALREMILTGTIEAKYVVGVPAHTDGTVERLSAMPGAKVYEGQLLAHIDNPKLDGAAQNARAEATRAQVHATEVQAQLSAARLELSRARAEAVRTSTELDRAEKAFRRQETLMNAGATPRVVFEKAQGDFRAAQDDAARLGDAASQAEAHALALRKELESAKAAAVAKSQEADEAQAELAAGDVHATAGGTVVSVAAQVGSTVDRSVKDLFRIARDVKSLEAILTLPAGGEGAVRVGQGITVEIPEAKSSAVGTVREVAAGQITVDFTSPGPEVKPGMAAQAKIQVR